MGKQNKFVSGEVIILVYLVFLGGIVLLANSFKKGPFKETQIPSKIVKLLLIALVLLMMVALIIVGLNTYDNQIEAATGSGNSSTLESHQWNNMTEYFEKPGQVDCLHSDDRSRDENSAAMETCLKRYFVSGDYVGVSSDETDFQTVCDSDLKTDERIGYLYSGGQGDTPREQYLFEHLVSSGVDADISNEFDNYCSGICPEGGVGVEDRCVMHNSRIRRSVNHFNDLMSNMQACSEEGATTDTTGDGVNDSCSTDILTDSNMYSVLNDLIVTN